MFRVTKTVLAERDLDEIWYYVAVDNLNAADALLDRIDRSCRQLARQPKMGRARPELAPELRSIAVAPYVIGLPYKENEVIKPRL